MEGLRVVEDIVRFELDNKTFTSKLKNLRSDLKNAMSSLNIPHDELLKARASSTDVGADLYSEGEGKRINMNEIITSNFKRVEESLRVLEESAKLIGAPFGKVFKVLRYKVYDLEKAVSTVHCSLPTVCSKLNFGLYVIIDPNFSLGRSPAFIAKQAIKGGAKIIQLRDKKASKRRLFDNAKQLSKICKKAGVIFIVNDHIDICNAVDADGVHLGRDDVPLKAARSILKTGKMIGGSASNLREAVIAERLGADYVGVGPVFSTEVKSKVEPVGLKLLKQINNRLNIPVVAIGGINKSNISSVRRTGVKRVAVIRAVVGEKNVAKAVRRLRKAL
jgi:thiamine-phosphate pyrophosphorylase